MIIIDGYIKILCGTFYSKKLDALENLLKTSIYLRTKNIAIQIVE